MNNYSKIEINLIEWFNKNKEPWFFRKDRTPYKVWISEVALHQTRINAALEPLKRFLTIYPNVHSLAKSTEEKVMNAFRGLGYYNRAKNLLRGAVYLEKYYDGIFPDTFEELIKIPSIGSYTAAAILSICFQKKIGVLDGNVKRILSRLLFIEKEINDISFIKTCEKFQNSLFSQIKLNSGDLNEAFMELGQKICTPKNPDCDNCPISDFCFAQKKNKQNILPIRKTKKENITVDWHFFILHYENKFLIQKYNSFCFLKHHWGFPSFSSFENSNENKYSFDNINELTFLKKNNYIESKSLKPIKHSITHHKITMHTNILNLNKVIKNNENLLWVNENEITKYLTASAMIKVWRAFKNN
ncbi:MAG: hypothetical protein OEZ22_12400 [Spirochaetia bacterium]|nr:hypothetical protein [Spirochaetia bacterium]